MHCFKQMTKVFLMAASFFSISTATTIYSEDFSTGAKNWPVLYPSIMPVDTNTSGKTFNITNKGTSLAMLRLKEPQMPAKIFPDTLTYSLTIKSFSTTKTNPALGIGINFDEGGGGYYLYIDKSQTFNLIRYQNGKVSYKPLAFLPHSSITKTVNTLKISKKGKYISAFCNNKLLATVTDSAYGPANIAIIISDSTSASFDDVVVTDTYEAGTADTTAEQKFTDATLTNWFTSLNPSHISYTPGKLTITNPEPASGVSGAPDFSFVNGNFINCSYKTIVKRTGGSDATATYGLSLLAIEQLPNGGYQYRTFAFVINSLSQYGIIHPDDSTYSMITATASPQPIHGGTRYDTLSVVKAGSKYQFKVNEALLREIDIPNTFKLNAAGIFVTAGSTVETNYFAAYSGSSAVKFFPTNQMSQKRSSGIQSKPMYVDIMGRSIRGSNVALSGKVILTKDNSGNNTKGLKALILGF